MVCRSCGAEIADKAIVCYRCGTPTADPVPPSRPPAAGPNWTLIVLMVAIIGAGALLIPRTPPGSSERIAAWVATWLVVFAAVSWSKRRRK
jgi:hypothetical protein